MRTEDQNAGPVHGSDGAQTTHRTASPRHHQPSSVAQPFLWDDQREQDELPAAMQVPNDEAFMEYDRTVAPRIWVSADLWEMIEAHPEHDCRLLALMIGLWHVADRVGRLKDNYRDLKALIFPQLERITRPAVDEMLQILADHGYIIRYEVAGDRYIQCVNFEYYQRPYAIEGPSRFPRCPGYVPRRRWTAVDDDD